MGNTKPSVKSHAIAFRFTPEFVGALRKAAKADNRTMTAYMEEAVKARIEKAQRVHVSDILQECPTPADYVDADGCLHTGEQFRKDASE